MKKEHLTGAMFMLALVLMLVAVWHHFDNTGAGALIIPAFITFVAAVAIETA